MPPHFAAAFSALPRQRWADLRADMQLPICPADLDRLRGHNDPVSLQEVEQVYLPLSRLLSLYVAATQQLSRSTHTFLEEPSRRVPYIIAVAGSVAVGKSTTSRLLQALLAAWPEHPRVALLTTDGFLYPNAVLAQRRRLQRKGFPESYDTRALLACLAAIKGGAARVEAPVYSHDTYDIVPGARVVIERPDILIVEGLNLLQVGAAGRRQPRLFVSDYFDFSIYVDAPIEHIEAWYVQRFLLFAEQARGRPEAYFYRFRHLATAQLQAYARDVWQRVNAVNLQRNILPYAQRARLIMHKGADHSVQDVWLRRL